MRNSEHLFPCKWLSISFPMRCSIKLMIISITYTCVESYPLSYSCKQLIKILACLWKLGSCFVLKYGLRSQKQLPEVFCKKGVWQNSPENTCARASFWIKLQKKATILLKKRLWRKCFTVNFAKFLRAPFVQNNYRWLFLKSACPGKF